MLFRESWNPSIAGAVFEEPGTHRLSLLEQLNRRRDSIHWLRDVNRTVRQLNTVCIKRNLVGRSIVLDPATIQQITILCAIVEVLWREYNARRRLSVQRNGDIFGTHEMVHAEVEPDHEILLLNGLVVKEFRKVLLWCRGQIDVLDRVGIGLIVMLARHGQVSLGHLAVFERERRVLHRQVEVGPAWDNAVAALFTPGVGFVLVDHAEHGLVVSSPVEGGFCFEIADVQLHLLEFPEFREPCLGLIHHNQVADLEGVGTTQDVEVGFVGQDVVVERSLRSRGNPWSVFGLIRVVEAGL